MYKRQLYFVFEFLEMNLYQLCKDREKLFPEAKVRNMAYQMIQATYYMHCLLYTSPSPRDGLLSRMPSSA